MKSTPCALVLSLALATKSSAADIYFCWSGANGYTMTGSMTVAEGRMKAPLVTEDDITNFKITGYAEGQSLGSWSIRELTEGTTWHLRFDPNKLQFLVGDRFSSERSQGWNADGNVQDCGSPGFGFSSGSYAQDICVDGIYIRDSSIDPETPLMVSTVPLSADCSLSFPLSKAN